MLIISRSIDGVRGRLVGRGEREVGVGLGQVGVTLAQDAHGLRRVLQVDQRLGLEHFSTRRKGRGNGQRLKLDQLFRDASLVLGLHLRRSHVIDCVIFDLGKPRLGPLQVPRRAIVIFLLERRNTQGQLGERAVLIFGMRRCQTLDPRPPRHRRRLPIHLDQRSQILRGRGERELGQ